MLGELQAGLKATAEQMKAELGEVVTNVHASIADINQQLRDNKTAGEQLMSAMEAQKAETVSQMENVKAAAQSEFNTHRGAIETVVTEVRGIQQSLQTLATGMQGELDGMKMELVSAVSLIHGVGPSGSVDSLKAEVSAMRAELLELKSLGGGGSSAPNRDGSNNRFGHSGFVPLKQMTPKTLGSREEQWRDGWTKPENIWICADLG